MIIINGAGSELARNYIASCQGNVTAISRGFIHQQANVTSINLQDLDSLRNVLLEIEGEKLVWINFAAYKVVNLIANISDSEMQKSLTVNYLTNFIAAKVLIPKMMKKKWGRFIFIDSVKASMGDIGCLAYSSSKAPNCALMRSIVVEYSKFNVTANNLAIGYANTPMFRSIPPEKRSKLLEGVPGKKFVDGAEVINTINLILSNQSINGQTICLDGGIKSLGGW